MGNKKTRLILIHIVALLVIGFCFFKYPEEINMLKGKIYSKLSTRQESETKDLTSQYKDYPVITAKDAVWYSGETLVYHAGGGIDGLGYTNSKEALEATLKDGHRLIELDFQFTSDRELVCVHKWTDILDTEYAPSADEFLSMRIYGKYTPMSAAMVVEYMRAYPDLYVVVDAKEDNPASVIENLLNLCNKEQDLVDRFVIQLYDAGQKSRLKELYPFRDENFLFTAYKFGPDRIGEILELCYREEIQVVTVAHGKWDEGTIGFFAEKGFTVFEHTVNRRDYAISSIEKGVYGFYTDFLCEEDLKK